MGLPSSLKSYFLLLVICFLNVPTINSKKEELFGGKSQALYVFGDSLVDSGNNNYLETKIKSNFPPYGSDFEGGKPTGRFSNGKTIADYIAIYYGLPLVPAYLGLTDEQKNTLSTGINYASASCGIFPDTGKPFGKCLSLSTQVDLFTETMEKNLRKQFKTQTEMFDHMSGSLFMTAIGVNDYVFFFNKTVNPNEFADNLLRDFLIQIERLYKLGARKFFINNIKPLGCYPNIIAHTDPIGSCNDNLNLVINIFNTKLRTSLSDLLKKLPDTSFLYSDYFNFMLGLKGPSSKPAKPSSLDTTCPCCPKVYDGGLTTMCTPGSTTCPEPETHIFFDPFHPTQLANSMYATKCFEERTVCFVVS